MTEYEGSKLECHSRAFDDTSLVIDSLSIYAHIQIRLTPVCKGLEGHVERISCVRNHMAVHALLACAAIENEVLSCSRQSHVNCSRRRYQAVGGPVPAPSHIRKFEPLWDNVSFVFDVSTKQIQFTRVLRIAVELIETIPPVPLDRAYKDIGLSLERNRLEFDVSAWKIIVRRHADGWHCEIFLTPRLESDTFDLATLGNKCSRHS